MEAELIVSEFQQKIWTFYQKNRRDFAWRVEISPYRVLVSEIMLQQTQTHRVTVKFDAWMQKFPDLISLAHASTHEVLSAWQGLGYNRRGLALYNIAKSIVTNFNGQLPADPAELQQFSGIGPNTAASICAFAFNMPVVFIETNIRTIFLHEFFSGQVGVADKELMPLIAATVDQANPREWYYALMDYGVFLKKELKANNKSSKHYVRQSTFMGSRRQVRGAIVQVLTQFKTVSREDLDLLVNMKIVDNSYNVSDVLQQLINEGLVKEQSGFLFL